MAEGTCSVEGCDRYDRVRRGMCSAHYERWRRTGDAGGGAIRRIDPDRICVIDGCGRPYWATDLCSIHYVRKFKSGDPRAQEPIAPRGTDTVGYDGALGSFEVLQLTICVRTALHRRLLGRTTMQIRMP